MEGEIPLDFAGHLRTLRLLFIFCFWPWILNNTTHNDDSNNTLYLQGTFYSCYLLFRLSLTHGRTFREVVLLLTISILWKRKLKFKEPDQWINVTCSNRYRGKILVWLFWLTACTFPTIYHIASVTILLWFLIRLKDLILTHVVADCFKLCARACVCVLLDYSQEAKVQAGQGLLVSLSSFCLFLNPPDSPWLDCFLYFNVLLQTSESCALITLINQVIDIQGKGPFIFPCGQFQPFSDRKHHAGDGGSRL